MLDIDKIQENLNKARHELREVEGIISKVEGKPFSSGPNRFANKGDGKRRFPQEEVIPRTAAGEAIFGIKRGGRNVGGGGRVGPIISRRLGDTRALGVFGRLSGLSRSKADDYEDEGDKKPVLSKVLATPVEVPSRQEIIAAQTSDEFSKQRNKRMFGALMGTLQKFKREETQGKEREEKRMKIELKLEEDAKREKEQMIKEKHELLSERKRKESDIKRIEWSLNRAKEFAAWEAHVLPTTHFIRTQCKPHIFYLPRTHNPKTLELLEASKQFTERMIEKRRQNLHDEIELSERKAKRIVTEEHVQEGEEDETENKRPETEEEEEEHEEMDVQVNKENVFRELDKNCNLGAEAELDIEAGKSELIENSITFDETSNQEKEIDKHEEEPSTLEEVSNETEIEKIEPETKNIEEPTPTPTKRNRWDMKVPTEEKEKSPKLDSNEENKITRKRNKIDKIRKSRSPRRRRSPRTRRRSRSPRRHGSEEKRSKSNEKRKKSSSRDVSPAKKIKKQKSSHSDSDQ